MTTVRRMSVLLSVAAIVAAACSGSATPAPTQATVTQAPVTQAPVVTPAAKACTVGVSWNNFQQPR